MARVSLDVEAWPGESLIATLLEAASPSGARATVTRKVSAALLHDLGGFGGLARATVEDIENQLVTGPRLRLAPRACARRVAAAFELGRRAATDTAAPASIASSADVATWASRRLCRLDHEELWLLALDGRSRLRAVRCVAKGGLHGMGVRAADPLRIALRAAASGFVLVHNHPSGDPTPSLEDIAFTRRVAAAAVVVGVPLLDHVVVAQAGFSSVPFAVDGAAASAGPVEA
jgi:DNA repair protein RadC